MKRALGGHETRKIGNRWVRIGAIYTNSALLPQIKLVTFGGSPTLAPGGFSAWRSDSAAFVFFSDASFALLYDIASGKTTPFEANSNVYV